DDLALAREIHAAAVDRDAMSHGETARDLTLTLGTTVPVLERQHVAAARSRHVDRAVVADRHHARTTEPAREQVDPEPRRQLELAQELLVRRARLRRERMPLALRRARRHVQDEA